MRISLSQTVLNALAISTTVLAVSAATYRVVTVTKNTPPPLVSTLDDWNRLATGAVVGEQAASVKLVVFSDFQCPFCKVFADSARAVLSRYPNDVQMIFRHRPIPELHPRATLLAQLAVCANQVGRFREMHDQLFSKQDSLNSLSWQFLAESIGVSDTASIGKCMRSDATLKLLEEDRKAADDIGLSGTPVVLVNETMIRGVPPGRMLDSLVRHAIKKTR
jgi:protein-disulfide isomerase